MQTFTLAFAGTPEFAVPALDALAASRHRVAGVYTQPDRRAGRGRELTPSPVKRRALELRLPVFQPEQLRDETAREQLGSLNVDALVVVAYGLILPEALLGVPRLGCFNIHASLLPRWRGAAPIQRALLAGDEVTGVTIMRMEKGLDTGPMILAQEIPIGAHDTSASLQARLAVLGARLMLETLERLARGAAIESPQPAQGVTHAAKITKAEAEVDWSLPAAHIDRQIRAFDPWPVAQTRSRGETLRLWEGRVLDPTAVVAEPGRVIAHTAGGIDVACGQGSLRLTQVQWPGRKRSAAGEVLHARSLAGERLGRP